MRAQAYTFLADSTVTTPCGAFSKPWWPSLRVHSHEALQQREDSKLSSVMRNQQSMCFLFP